MTLMRRKTTARRILAILLHSRLALFAFGISALGLPFGVLPASSAIAAEQAKQQPTSGDQRTAADDAKVIRPAPTDGLNQISWWSVLAFVLTGFVFAGSAIPLILQRVPPNPWYGFRVQATLENPAVWYPVNRCLGKCLFVCGLFVIVTSVGLSFVPGINPLAYAFSCVGALAVGSHLLLIPFVVFPQLLSRRHATHRDTSVE
jgi:hypothetical protein